MKKALVIFLALALVGSVFAAEPAAEVKVAEFTGDASVTFGIDLDTEKSGFKNEESATLKLNLLNGGDKSTTGDGIWGELVIKTDGDNFIKMEVGTVTQIPMTVKVDKAIIHFGPVYMGIQSGNLSYGGDFWFPNALNWKDEKDPYNRLPSSEFEVTPALGTMKDPYNQGFLLGYKNDMFKVEGSIRSYQDRDAANKPVYWTNKYAMGVYGEVKPIKDLRIGVGGAYVLGDMSKKEDLSMGRNNDEHKNDFAVFAGADYVFDINDSFRLQPVVAYKMYKDYKFTDPLDATKGEYAKEFAEGENVLGFGLRFGFKKAKSKDGNSLLQGFFEQDMAYNTVEKKDKTLLPGVSVYSQFDLGKDQMKNNLPLLVTFYPGELVKGLNAAAFAHFNLGPDASKKPTAMYNGADFTAIIGGKGLQFGAAASYDIVVKKDVTIVPAVGALFTHGKVEDAADKENTKTADKFCLEAKVDVKGLVQNTTFTLAWDNGYFGSYKDKAGSTTTKKDMNKKGLVTLKAKIAF